MGLLLCSGEGGRKLFLYISDGDDMEAIAPAASGCSIEKARSLAWGELPLHGAVS